MKLYIYQTDIKGSSDNNYCGIIETSVVLANNAKEANKLIVLSHVKIKHIESHILIKSFNLKELSSTESRVIY